MSRDSGRVNSRSRQCSNPFFRVYDMSYLPRFQCCVRCQIPEEKVLPPGDRQTLPAPVGRPRSVYRIRNSTGTEGTAGSLGTSSQPIKARLRSPPSCFVYFTPNLASCDLNTCHTSHPRQQPPNRVLQLQVASLIQTHSFWLLFNHLSSSPRHARFILTNVSIETVPFLAATPCIITSNSRGTVMAMRPSSRPPVGAAAWCADERSSAVEIAQSEVEEFAYSARNEVEWLNEHMADIFSENHMYVSDASNLAHRR